MHSTLTALFFTLTLFHASRGQQADVQIKFQLAQSYERSNNWERAVSIYEELYAGDSTNVVFFESLRKGYMHLKRHDDAIRIITAQLRMRPNDVGLYAHLGVVYVREGDENKAMETWNSAIARDPRNVNTYYTIANAATESRLLDRAIEVYMRGRATIGDPMLFTVETAYIYAMMLNFTDATREYVKLLLHTPSQLSFVQSRMGLYTYRPDARREATTVVEQTLLTVRDNVALHQLLAWLFMEGKQFERAYETYVQLDRKTNAGGRELFSFAERAFKEKAYGTAAKAYETIIAQYPTFDRLPQAKFGFARTTEELVTAEDSTALKFPTSLATGLSVPGNFINTENTLPAEAQSKFTPVLARYNEIVRDYPNTEVAAQSLYRIALLQFENLFDLDAAAITLRQFLKNYAFLPHRAADAAVLLGDVLVAKGDLVEAEKFYRMGLQFAGTREQSMLRLAEMEFFRGKFRETTSLLLELTKEPKSDAANDALSLLSFLQEHEQRSSAALTEFAKANLLVRQRKFPDALLILQKLEEKFATTPLIEESLMLSADLLAATGRYSESIATYQRLIKQFPESIVLDRAFMRIGYMYEVKLNNTTEAIAYYQKILEEFPQSLYAAEARRRIRELRGESL